MANNFKLSTRSKNNRDVINGGVDPRLIEVSDLAITISLVDFGHGPDSGKRTAASQHELHMKGASRCDGYDIKSNHQSGKALDFYAFVDGRASWEHDHLAMIAAAFLQAASILGYQLSWGGFWQSKKPTVVNSIPYGWDCPHVEIVGETHG